MSVLNLKRIALFVQKLLGGFQNFEIRSRDPSHAHLWVVLFSICRRDPSSVSVPNLKRIAEFVQKLLGGPEIRKLAHVTRPRPLMGRFMVPTQGDSVIRLCTKFEADWSIRSKVIKGS